MVTLCGPAWVAESMGKSFIHQDGSLERSRFESKNMSSVLLLR